MFLRSGELNKIAKPTQGDLEFSTLHEESFSHSDRYEPIACPDCGNATMEKVEFNIHTGIVLDYCAACEGFWLDGPELDRINDEVKALDEAAEPGPDTGMLWFARFIWSLPK
jgi:Zn-finger nucleic acid-binding protein